MYLKAARTFLFQSQRQRSLFIPRVEYLGLDCITARGKKCMRKYISMAVPAFAFIHVRWLPACLPALPCLGGYEFSYSTIVHVYSHRSPRLGAQWCSPFRRWNKEKGRGRRERAVSTVSKRYEAQSGNRHIARGNFPPPCWLS